MDGRGEPYAKFLYSTFTNWRKLPLDLLKKIRLPLLRLRDKYLKVAENPKSSECDLYSPFAELIQRILRTNPGKIEYVKTHGKRKLLGVVGKTRRRGVSLLTYATLGLIKSVSPHAALIRKPHDQSGPVQPYA